MHFHNFELEYFQSQFERTVDYNLADSSVKCLTTREWLTDDEAEQLLSTGLYYPEVNGTSLLRERIAELYDNAHAGNILVTVGAAQANSLICNTLLEAGDEVIVVSPGYRQVWGLAKNLGCRAVEFQLRPEDHWRPDLDRLAALAGNKTKLIAVVNPNNPTGTIFSDHEMQRIVEICEGCGAWLHADEVYQGTELENNSRETPSFWRHYDKLACTNSLSKAYGLAGLRIGWAVAAPKVIEALWRRHEYAVIAAAGPSMKLAEIALQPAKRAILLERQRQLSRTGHGILSRWAAEQEGRFLVQTPAATSIAFVGYDFDMPSVELANHIRQKASVLVAPGAYLGTEHHLRITVGYDPEKMSAAVERIGAVVSELVVRT
jgi:aspartate/methionine/tyrosine aminotransferase